MSFEKGKSGNPSGRKKGSKNKYNQVIQKKIEALLDCFTKKDILAIYKDLKKDKPETLVHFLAKIAPKTLALDAESSAINPILEALTNDKNISRADNNVDD